MQNTQLQFTTSVFERIFEAGGNHQCKIPKLLAECKIRRVSNVTYCLSYLICQTTLNLRQWILRYVISLLGLPKMNLRLAK